MVEPERTRIARKKWGDQLPKWGADQDIALLSAGAGAMRLARWQPAEPTQVLLCELVMARARNVGNRCACRTVSVNLSHLLLFGRHQKGIAIPDSQSFKDFEAFLFVNIDITKICRLKKYGNRLLFHPLKHRIH